jgi:uncharacterized protein YkwD
VPRSLPLVALALVALALPAAASAAPRAKKTSAERMIEKLNRVRAKHSLPPLKPSAPLQRTAGGYAKRLIKEDRFSHVGAPRASGFSSIGEALEIHRGKRALPGRAIRSWLRSSIHRSLVLGTSFRWIGAGTASGNFGGRRMTVWVLHLGRR